MMEFKHKAALFDLDGVIFDTEPGYTRFWNQMLARYYPDPEARTASIKGMTLFQMLDLLFSGALERERPYVVQSLNEFEQTMSIPYVPGFPEFVTALRAQSVKTAVVTSSNQPKMDCVYRQHPEFKGFFDAILTSEDFTESKPSPQCYLRSAARLGVDIQDCVVFEDSINGLKSGMAAGMYVVAVTTAHPASELSQLSHLQIPDFLPFC